MSFIDSIADFIADLMGCTDEECEARARQYATWLVVGVVAIIALVIIVELWRFLKGSD